jgi:Flp pilus assembly protein TadB
MGLTRAERGRLVALADDLALDDPRLARALAGRCYRLRPRGAWRHPRRRVRGRHIKVFASLVTLLALAAVAVIVLGAVLGQPLIIALGAFVLLDGPALLAVALLWQRRGQHRRPSPARRRRSEGRAA